ncbi:MAG: 5,10-methylenetetrahydrofolate reductase, partial [Firmicutes bacterium]|nr:5,10-methylenetetrahydrofolate reductase [Bacillota bacterium]
KAAGHIKVPIMVGIVLLKSAGMARFMNANVAGVFVPDKFIKIMAEASKEDRPRKSIEIAASLIKEMKGMCQGVHIMSLGWDRYVPSVLEAAELI